jgi:hypothetical protein
LGYPGFAYRLSACGGLQSPNLLSLPFALNMIRLAA